MSFVDELQSTGVYSFTSADTRRLLGGTDLSRKKALAHLKSTGRIASPRRGFYVIVPVEYRAAGAPPASWYIDDLMSYLSQPYYVALLSAAGLYGATHQQPMEFQVITDRLTRPAIAGRNIVRFYRDSHLSDASVSELQTETGSMRVSPPPVTVCDLVAHADSAGGWNNVATVIAEMITLLDPESLSHELARRETPTLQRLGYLFELSGAQEITDVVGAALSGRRLRWTDMTPGASPPSVSVERWRLRLDEPIEIDR